MAKTYSQACLSVTTQADWRSMCRLCEVGKSILQEKVREHIVSARSVPVFMHYSADGTPQYEEEDQNHSWGQFLLPQGRVPHRR
eukprot:9933053-Lingulodinium_polyedra.AAC.1